MCLFSIGGHIERNFGSNVFLRIFTTCASAGCLSAFFSQPPPPMVSPIYGNNSVIAGMLTYLILKYRSATIMIFVFPLRTSVAGLILLTHSLFFDRSGA